MAEAPTVGIRQSVRVLQQEYDAGNTKPLEDVVRAWKGIMELPPEDPRSFFVLGGYHGEPFSLRDAVDELSPTNIYAYWGGYCNHGNALFPTWHRVYVRKLEEALQSIVPGVMLPFWDETDEETQAKGIPTVLTDEKFVLDGQRIPNPLRSFVLPEEIQDGYWGDNQNGEHSPYFKPKDYETVRYPLSGLVGNPEDQKKTAAHNALYPDPVKNLELLNSNVRAWLHGGDPTPEMPDPHGFGTYAKFVACLRAPNYTVFSNTTSAESWNNAGHAHAVALEDPHNDIHLSVGGFDLPLPQFGGDASTSGQVAGANGDMGENNTAALDPIFFFHHCHVDRMFWLWQKLNPEKKVEIIEGYAGTNSSDSQGPTPEIPPGTHLTMDSPLRPFKKADDSWFTSQDCVDVEALGYTYGPGSLEELIPAPDVEDGGSKKVLVVRGMNRAHFKGSFTVTAQAVIDDEDATVPLRHLGHQSVLSRWNVEGCANCQTHLDVVARFPLTMLSEEEVSLAMFSARILHRSEEMPQGVKLRLSVEG
jgi:tyrosinase